MLAAGIVLYGGYLIVSVGVSISKRTRMTPIICTIAAVVNVGLNFWVIPRWGIRGAGATTVIGYAVLLLLGWLNAERGYPVSYDWARVGRVTLVVVAIIALSQWVIPGTGVVALVVRVLLAALFPLTLVPVGGLTRADVRKCRSMLTRRRGRAAEAAT
jgi:O-antigen/teichoic acid export membrane protein